MMNEHQYQKKSRNSKNENKALVESVEDKGKSKGGYRNRKEYFDFKVPDIGNINSPEVQEKNSREGDISKMFPVIFVIEREEVARCKNNRTNESGCENQSIVVREFEQKSENDHNY